LGDHEGRLFFARQYIEGQTLAQLVAQQASIPPTDRLQFMVTVCAVLAYAHRCGLAGLAVEFGDVMIGPEDEPHIVDLTLDAAG
jgi:hypothetical protein